MTDFRTHRGNSVCLYGLLKGEVMPTSLQLKHKKQVADRIHFNHVRSCSRIAFEPRYRFRFLGEDTFFPGTFEMNELVEKLGPAIRAYELVPEGDNRYAGR